MCEAGGETAVCLEGLIWWKKWEEGRVGGKMVRMRARVEE